MSDQDREDDPGSEDPQENGDNSDSNRFPVTLPPEIAKEIPPEVQSKLSAWIVQITSHRGPMPHPLAEKINEDHIDKVLDLTDTEGQRRYDYACSTRWFKFWVFVITIGVFIWLVVYLIDKPEILSPILTAILGFAAGFGIGKKV